jgi:transposase
LKLFVGIDVSSEELEACFMNPEGDTLETLKVKNDLNGASRLRDRIVAASDKLSSSEIHIGLEATSVYSWHPAMYLHEDESLRQRNTKVFTINPKLINKFREAYADLDKTDRIDDSRPGRRPPCPRFRQGCTSPRASP